MRSIAPSSLRYLREELARGRMHLFTGAGFSADARDAEGKKLPGSVGLVTELWPLCFPGEPFDETSSLEDVFAHGAWRCPRKLERLFQRRFRVDPSTLPAHYRVWFQAPWRRMYTLNQDDLESAVARRFDPPRKMKSVSALGRMPRSTSPRVLQVVHLNGMMAHGIHRVTFSQEQYARRLAVREPWYAALAHELVRFPFVFVGTPLEEPLLWQHLTMRLSRTNARVRRPRSFLVSRSLPRAREAMLSRYNVEWIGGTAREFAEAVLAPLEEAFERGHDAIRRLRRTKAAT
jgi:hypothetical protein